MANYYVRSGASGASDGSTWADAYTAIESGAEAVSGPGNTLYVADGHSESHASAITLALGGAPTVGSMRVLCVNDTSDPEPPTAVATGALVATTGGNNLTIDGTGLVRGMHFKAGDSTSTASILIGSGSYDALVLENCTLELGNTNTSSYIGTAGPSAEARRTILRDCTFTFGSTGQKIRLQGALTRLDILGGAIAGAAITTLFDPNHVYPPVSRIIGLDASACATGVTLVSSSTGSNYLVWIIGMTLPAGWSGAILSGAPQPSVRVELIDSTDGTTRYRRWIEDWAGTIRDTIHLGESVYTTAGTYDGVARYSYKFSANSYANNRAGWLIGPEMSGYAETAAAHTATVEICHDGASALTDQDVWLEVFVDGQWVTDRNANPLAAGTAQATSAVEWTGDTGTGPNGSATWHTLKLVCSFTPGAAGPVLGRVVLAKASTTVYVDPSLTVAAS